MNKKVAPQDRKILFSQVVKVGEKNQMNQVITDPNVMFNEVERSATFMTGSEVIRAAIKVANLDGVKRRR